jgi:hypothetical protein
LLPDSAGNTVVLLAQISRQLDGLANGTLANRASSPSLPQTNWQPPASAVWVNALWFLSLVISLFCALLATLQQRWARQYLQLTHPQRAIHKRAIIRSFFAEGVSRFHLPIIVEAIPALLHISVFLFLAGLAISLLNIHHTIGYIVLAASVACAVVYAAITVLPAICHDSPYTSPFSAPVWYVSRKTILSLLKTVDCIADFVKKHTSLGKTSPVLPLSDQEQAGNVSRLKERLSRDMTRVANYVALKSDKGLIARALGWTLDKMDEEGELVKFAAGIPAFSRSTEVKDAVSILEEAPKCSKSHSGLYRHITNLLIRSAKPGFLPDSKLLPESVREERIKTCLEALYFLPNAIKNILRRAAEKKDNKTVIVALSPLLRSVESWRVAERLSIPNRRIHPDVTIAAQCVATVLASQTLDEQTEPIVMQWLRIKIKYRDNYMSQPHSLRLRNLNRFLENTALKAEHIEMDPEKYSIFVSAACLAKKELNFEDAWLKLRQEHETLMARIASFMTGSSSENARRNMTGLYSELAKPHDRNSFAQSAQAGPSSAPSPNDNDDDDDAERAGSSATPPVRTLQAFLPQYSDGTYIPMVSPMSDTYPLMPVNQFM